MKKSNKNSSLLTSFSSNAESTAAILTTKCMQETPTPKMETSQRLADKINYHVRDTVESTIVIGNFLIMAKEQFPNSGEWRKWLHNKVEISEDQAENYMNVARIYPDPKSLSASEMSKAFELITYTC